MARTSSKPARPQMKPANLRTFHHALLGWYKTHGRHDLPWRTTEDAYAIWISEVMLQQTQVATVRERFYHPFLKKFPTIESLAAAPTQSVMKAWEGLGYYSRARNLHKAAIQLTQTAKAERKNKVSLPAAPAELIALPGIGRNTASAILAFAHHQPVAILEANVKRVVARIFALKTPSDQQLWDGADTLLNPAHPFDHNQAMMDLGSIICTPKKPDCPRCPANNICQGQHAPEQYPAKKAKKSVPVREVTIQVTEDADGRLYLEKRDANLLGGLWGFPQKEYAVSRPHEPSASKAARSIAQEVRSAEQPMLGTVTHVYSHFKLVGHVVHIRTKKSPNPQSGWYSRKQIAALPLSKLDHKVLALVEKRHTPGKKLRKTSSPRQKH